MRHQLPLTLMILLRVVFRLMGLPLELVRRLVHLPLRPCSGTWLCRRRLLCCRRRLGGLYRMGCLVLRI